MAEKALYTYAPNRIINLEDLILENSDGRFVVARHDKKSDRYIALDCKGFFKGHLLEDATLDGFKDESFASKKAALAAARSGIAAAKLRFADKRVANIELMREKQAEFERFLFGDKNGMAIKNPEAVYQHHANARPFELRM